MTGRAFTPEDLLASIRTLSTGSPSDLAQLAKQLKSSEDTLNRAAVGGAAALAEALASLDARTHTLGVLYLLEAQAHAPAPADQAALFSAALRFLVAASPQQVKLAPEKFAALSRRVRDTALKLGTPGRGAAPLAAAARAVRPRPGCLTPQHGDCLLLSLAARNLAAALPLLGDDVLEVDPAATGSAPTDFVLFCFYGGAVLCAAKRFDRAAVLFAQALAAPATALNAIQVACYKKLVLSSLLSSGAVPPLPKFVSPAVSRHVKGYATPYSELEKAFTSASPKDAAKALTTHEAAFKADGCWGLAKQVASALGVRCVARLTDVYLTQPLPSVATAAGLEGADREDGAAKLVRRAVGNGSVGAKIDSRARVVAFAPPPPPGGDRSSARLLHGRIDDVLALVARVGAMDEAIELEPAFITKQLQSDRLGGEPTLAARLGAMGGAPDDES